jgi:hypothetical protein
MDGGAVEQRVLPHRRDLPPLLGRMRRARSSQANITESLPTKNQPVYSQHSTSPAQIGHEPQKDPRRQVQMARHLRQQSIQSALLVLRPKRQRIEAAVSVPSVSASGGVCYTEGRVLVPGAYFRFLGDRRPFSPINLRPSGLYLP